MGSSVPAFLLPCRNYGSLQSHSSSVPALVSVGPFDFRSCLAEIPVHDRIDPNDTEFVPNPPTDNADGGDPLFSTAQQDLFPVDQVCGQHGKDFV